MTGSPQSADGSPVPDTGAPARPGRVRGLWDAARAFWSREAGSRRRREVELARILDLFEEHVYAGEITSDGRYVHHASMSTVEGLIGGSAPPDVEAGRFWESRIAPADRAQHEAFNRSLLDGEDAEVTYRVVGLDGVTRILRDRARPRRLADGSVRVEGIISDITAREETAARLDEASDRFTSLLDVVGAHVYLALALPDGTIEELFQGPGGDRLLGGAEPDPEMINWDAAVHADDRPAYDAFNRALGRGEDSEVTYRLIGADGITRWVHDRAACRPRPDGTFEVSGIVSDVTERRRLEDELQRSMRVMKIAHRELERARAHAELRAATDELTSTFNRRHFAQIATETLATGTAACGLLLLDADYFKQINDAYGHAVGDAVLIDLAHRLSAGLEPGDCLARWGGEEFAILLPGARSADELVRRAERFRHAISDSPIAHGDVHLDLTISVGGALAPIHGATLDALLERADSCLYDAKHRGRNCVSLRPGNTRSADAPNAAPNAVELARALAFTSSLRDGIPQEHSEEVARLAGLTAEHLALPARVAQRCRLAGWLHDVGKLAVPEQILNKPGPLDDAESEVMRTHSGVGADIVHRIPALRQVAPAVRHHHERYSGDGYPDGLAGQAIPIEARIIAAADAYATMTADRPYSPARTQQQAAAELRRSAGSHFDPAVAEALLAVLGLADQIGLDAA
jgi:diguanylate cyclase (GGDEF)-like protein/putative nucleotidyltransferase with HDIG domain